MRKTTFFFQLCFLIAAEVLAQTPTVKLSSGQEIPVLGLGTRKVKAGDVDKILTAALQNKYRLFETSPSYGNEEAIGKSLKKWLDKGGKREQLFVMTKLPPSGNRAADVKKYIQQSLQKLGLKYIDMYLIEFPVSIAKDPKSDAPSKNKDGSVVLDTTADLAATWKALEAQVKANRVKSIGLRNFNQQQIENLLKSAEIKPSVLESEISVYHQQKSLLEFAKKNNIVVISCSPWDLEGKLLTDDQQIAKTLMPPSTQPAVLKIAENHQKIPAQVILRYYVQNGVVVIANTMQPNLIKASTEIFDFKLTDDEMKQLSQFDIGEEGRIFNFLTEYTGRAPITIQIVGPNSHENNVIIIINDHDYSPYMNKCPITSAEKIKEDVVTESSVTDVTLEVDGKIKYQKDHLWSHIK